MEAAEMQAEAAGHPVIGGELAMVRERTDKWGLDRAYIPLDRWNGGAWDEADLIWAEVEHTAQERQDVHYTDDDGQCEVWHEWTAAPGRPGYDYDEARDLAREAADDLAWDIWTARRDGKAA